MKTIKYNYSCLLVSIACASLLSACGGGSKIEAGALEVPMATKVQTLEGFDVSVTGYALTTDPSVAVRYEIALDNPQNQIKIDPENPEATGLRAAIGTDFLTGKSTAVAKTGSQGVWSVTVPKPLIPGSGLLVTFELLDGDIFETGEKDFVY